MRAVAFSGYGDADVLAILELDRPRPRTGEALVRIHAAAVNPADAKWRAGMFASFAPVEFPHIPGYDIAGKIVSSAHLAPGTRVVAMLDPFTKGGYADYVAVGEAALALMPDDLSFAAAAAIPTAGLTGLQLAEDAADVRPGDRVLISGATGAVGRVALWAARQRGAEVIAAVREDRAALARALGAGDVWSLPLARGERRKVAHFIDTVGGDVAARLGAHLVPGGRFVTVATTPIPSEGLAAQPIFYAVRPDRTQLERLTTAVATEQVSLPPLEAIGFDGVGAAHRRLEAGGFAGKFILVP